MFDTDGSTERVFSFKKNRQTTKNMKTTHHVIAKSIFRSVSSEGYKQNEVANFYFCTGRYQYDIPHNLNSKCNLQCAAEDILNFCLAFLETK